MVAEAIPEKRHPAGGPALRLLRLPARPAAHGLTKAEVAERVRASRAEQGLPAVVADPAVLRRIASVLCSADTRPVPAAAKAA